MKKNKGFKFKPFSTKQLQILNWWRDGSPFADCDIMIADGSIRSGKTIACICSYLQWSQSTFDAENFIIAGRTIGSLKKNVIGPLQQILTAWGWKFTYNRSENYIIIGDNTYYMYDASNQASQDKLQGLTAAGAYADEVGLFPQNFIDQMIGRCSVDGAKIFMNCNPESPQHYIKVEFIDKAKEKNIFHVHLLMDDNLSLSAKVKERFARMFSGVFHKRFILGMWVIAEGLVYSIFDKERHTYKDLALQGYCEYYISIDYGTANPCSMGLWCIFKGKAYRIKEYYYSSKDSKNNGRQKTDEEYYSALEKLAGDKVIQAVIVDPSAASFIETIRRHGKFTVKKAVNEVLDGIRVTASMLNADKLLFHHSCVDSIREFGLYSWDEKLTEDGKEKVIKEFDHAMDDIRYFCNTILRREFKWDNWGGE